MLLTDVFTSYPSINNTITQVTITGSVSEQVKESSGDLTMMVVDRGELELLL